MRSVYGIGVSIALVLLTGCQMPVAPTTQTGQTEQMTGRYMQWSGGCVGAPPRSRSDWMLIHAQYGCVYVHGAAPQAKRGKMVQIEGVWQFTPDGRRYIERR